MSTFADYLKRTATQRQWMRTVDSGRVHYRILLEGQASVHILVDELNPAHRGYVMSEAWPVPVTSAAYVEFMQQALNFNRNALHHLPCGIVQDANNASLYRLTWLVSAIEQPDAAWRQELRLFGALVQKAWQTMPVPGQSTNKRALEHEHQVIFMP
jgi:hypothetical protein